MSDPFDNPGVPPADGSGVPPTPPPAPQPPIPPPPAPASFGPPTEPVYASAQQAPVYAPLGDPTGTSVVLPTVQRPPRRSRGKMVGAFVGVVALLTAGTFAVAQLRSNDTNGGAASPEELGSKLVAAFDHEDVLGAIDLLLPGERQTFRQPMIDLVHELTRLEVADKSADLNKIGGVDITVNDPKITVAETNVSDIAKVTISATSTMVVDGKAVPIGGFLIDNVFDGKRPDLDTKQDSKRSDLSFASVERDGRWYVSLFYSAAERMRGDKDIPAKGVTPAGASTPEGAVDNMLTALEKLDITKMIAGLNPNEAEALQRYAPLFIDDAQRKLDDFAGHITISSPEYSVTGSGNTRQVGIDAIKFTADSNGTKVDVAIKGGCVTMSSRDTSLDSCDAVAGLDKSVDKYLDQQGITDTAPLHTLIADVRKTFSDFEMHGIVVDNVNGKWFVSPIGSLTELLLSTLRALDRNEIETLIKDGRAVVSAFSNAVATGSDSTGSDSTSTTANSDWYSCISDASDPRGCIHDGVANGSFDSQYIPVPFLYPDCGLFDYYAGDSHYSDAPDVFLKTIEPGRKCLLNASEADGIDVSFLTPELAHPECFKNLNPYDYSDEAAYNAAYDCVSANS